MIFLLCLLLTLELASLGLVLQNLNEYRYPSGPSGAEDCLISICIPARNEASNIAAILQAVGQQTYKHLEILVLDDGSEDDTRQIAMETAGTDPRFKLIAGAPIQAGWAGKCHACAQLAAHAKGEFVLFLDADTRPQPELTASLHAEILNSDVDFISGFPRQITGSFWEVMVLPMLQVIVMSFLPVRQVRTDPSPAFAAACGQVLFTRRSAYEQVGGHSSIRTSFHDGLQLARKFKRAGKRIQLVDLEKLISCRMYQNGRDVWNGFTRNTYEGIGSIPALITVTASEFTLFCLPFILLAWGVLRHTSWVTLAATVAAVALTIRLIQVTRFKHALNALLLPISALSVITIQWASLFRKSGTWKGRKFVHLSPGEPTGTQDMEAPNAH